MRKHGISDHDASALLKGRAPVARPDLVPLADAVSELRAAAFETLPRPSAGLASRLDVARATGISTSTVPSPDSGAVETSTRETTGSASLQGRVKSMFTWFAGLGIAAKVALGLTVAAAAGVTGVGAVGAFQNLAPAVSDGEVVVPTDAPTVEPTGEPTGEPTAKPDTFGQSVSERAHELGKGSDGRAFGEEISGEAQQLGDDKRQNDGTTTDDGTADEGTADDGTADDGVVNGNKPETPGPQN